MIETTTGGTLTSAASTFKARYPEMIETLEAKELVRVVVTRPVPDEPLDAELGIPHR